jgi:DNA repair exonuclease SbcCD ATPase subunit
MNATALRKQLKKAEQDLNDLRAELPNYERLLDDNTAEEARLRQEKAGIDDLAKAKGRVNVARELLDQHRHETAEASAKVSDLEKQIRRAEQEAHLDALLNKQEVLRATRRERFLSWVQHAQRELEALLDLEAEVTVLHHDAAQAERKLKPNAAERTLDFGGVGIDDLKALGIDAQPQHGSRWPGGLSFRAGTYQLILDPFFHPSAGRGRA